MIVRTALVDWQWLLQARPSGLAPAEEAAVANSSTWTAAGKKWERLWLPWQGRNPLVLQDLGGLKLNTEGMSDSVGFTRGRLWKTWVIAFWSARCPIEFFYLVMILRWSPLLCRVTEPHIIDPFLELSWFCSKVPLRRWSSFLILLVGWHAFQAYWWDKKRNCEHQELNSR